MSVLLLQLAGPLQAWGASSRFPRRTTEPAPTKSGVVGLLAAALGRPRTDDIGDLAALRFGVRLDQPGSRIRDFQTAHHGETGKSMPISERFYLADAVFVAAVEGDSRLIDSLYDAVRRPRFLPYLGRRSCPPSRPLDLGVTETELEVALCETEWRASAWYQRMRRRDSAIRLEVRTDVPPDDSIGDSVRDLPLSFDPRHRRYGLRSIGAFEVTVANPAAEAGGHPHDPTTLLDEL